MDKVKIVQVVIGPDNSEYQSALLGLGSDGVIYRADNDNKWHEYFPAIFSGEKIEEVPNVELTGQEKG